MCPHWVSLAVMETQLRINLDSIDPSETQLRLNWVSIKGSVRHNVLIEHHWQWWRPSWDSIKTQLTQVALDGDSIIEPQSRGQLGAMCPCWTPLAVMETQLWLNLDSIDPNQTHLRLSWPKQCWLETQTQLQLNLNWVDPSEAQFRLKWVSIRGSVRWSVP